MVCVCSCGVVGCIANSFVILTHILLTHKHTRMHARTHTHTHTRTHTVTQCILDHDPKEETAKAFQLFDDDNTGKISLRNLLRVAGELGEDMSEEELRVMIDEFDLDSDGESESMGR